MNFNQPVRKIIMSVGLYEGSTAIQIIDKDLVSLEITRIGDEGKIFGYGVGQKLNVKIIDPKATLSISTANNLVVNSGAQAEKVFPNFYVTEVNRDEVTNELSVTAYDRLQQSHTTSEIKLTSYTIKQYAEACASLIGARGLVIKGVGADETCFDTSYPEGANLEGTETIREVLDAIAEATQTIYFVNKEEQLVFKRLDKTAPVNFTIDKSKYYALTSKTNRRLVEICSVTELGDNVSAKLPETGTTQFVRDNPFWTLREDIATLVDNALKAVGGLTINQFECDWRGDLTTEIGDKIALTTKENKTVTSFLLNDTINYNGALSEKTSWNYNNDDDETASNPSDLGEALKQTYAKVDKVNKKIDLVVSENVENADRLSKLELDAQNITASVTELQKSTDEAIGGVHDGIEALKNEVNASISSNDAKINIIEKEIADGVERVTTSTGFTFDKDGLTVSKQDTEMSTKITEDGMQVLKNDEAVLTANNRGVDAQNLHAVTYLIIGNNSRLEDFTNKDGETRTACFWIQDIQ